MDLNATLFAQLVVFLILGWFTMKFVWPPIVQALDERSEKIANGLASAERGKLELELASKRSTQTIRESKEKSAQLIGQAEKRASQIIEEAKADAKVEHDRIVANAQEDIEQQILRAREGLRDHVAQLAVLGAEQVLRREVNAQAHNDMLTKLRQEL